MNKRKLYVILSIEIFVSVLLAQIAKIIVTKHPEIFDKSMIPDSFVLPLFIAGWVVAVVVLLILRKRKQLKQEIRTQIAHKVSFYFIYPCMTLWLIMFSVSNVIDLNSNAIGWAFLTQLVSLIIIYPFARNKVLKDLDYYEKYES